MNDHPFLTLAAGASGPITLNLLGHEMPVLAALLSIAGVVLASIIAPPPPLGTVKRVALVALLCVLMLALILSDPKRSLIVSICWAIGIGYTGLPIIEEIRRRMFDRAGELTGSAPSTASAPQPNPPQDQDNA